MNNAIGSAVSFYKYYVYTISCYIYRGDTIVQEMLMKQKNRFWIVLNQDTVYFSTHISNVLLIAHTLSQLHTLVWVMFGTGGTNLYTYSEVWQITNRWLPFLRTKCVVWKK